MGELLTFSSNDKLIFSGKSGKLEAINATNAMCSHKINLAQVGDIDQAVVDWLKMAYEEAG